MYEYIAESNNYEYAFDILKGLCIKLKNEAFARPALTTREQRGETIVDNEQRLQILGKLYHFKEVSVTQIRNDCVRDTFIGGLCTYNLRQCLLRNITQDLSMAVDQVRALDTVQEYLESYTHYPPQL